ncbi:exodeoxyribonuclease VII small subunit [Streptomyces sp. MP131-18]|uniref:exodeoxyribonuclease VII small subunit n=1 Tax=Streptomyces sp. MP131-18 TaxID=1857892 RepID=UPI00097C9E7D|nr:exodeoxyribonuclease VII small subunit [Streptomyces sp. MP131-18]ONK11769.1 exodeoxyribonuclease VII small subunit [Streptomyces sp. MP131-18]
MTGTTGETGTTGTPTDGTGGAAAGAALGYEQARDELIDVVRRLEAGGATLEESLALWERGEELARICGEWLEGARARLDAALARDEAAEEADEEQTGEADGEDE